MTVGIERQFRLHREIAALIVAQESFAALAGPLDRASQPPRRPAHQREFRIERVAGAEVAADVARRDTHRGLRHAEDDRELALLPHHIAAAGMQRVAAAAHIVDADRGARLHRYAGDALHLSVERNDMRSALECRLGGGRVTDIGIHADIGAVLEHGRSAGRGRRHRAGDRIERLILHRDALGACLGGGERRGDHHRHRFAGEADLVGGKRVVRRGRGVAAVAIAQRDVGRAAQQRPVRDRLKSIRQQVGAGEHREHAIRGARLRRCDRADARMRMRRAHHHRIGLARQVDVVAETAGAGDEAQVLLPPDVAADPDVHVKCYAKNKGG